MAKIAKQRIHGILRPKLSSSAGLFEQRGDKWGGANRPQSLPHNPTEAEQAAEALFAKRKEKPIVKVTIRKPPPGRWIKRVISVEEVITPGEMSGQYAAEKAARLHKANADDPDMDRWTKAKRADGKPLFKDPKTVVITKSQVVEGKVERVSIAVPLRQEIKADIQSSANRIIRRISDRTKPKVSKIKERPPTPEANPLDREEQVTRLVQLEGISREKAFQRIQKEREARIKSRADYAEKKFK